MAERFQTRPERLAAERKKRRQEAVTDPPRLNPPYPYRAVPWTPGVFGARRVFLPRE